MKTGDKEIKLGVVETASPEDVLRRLEDLDIATVSYDHPPLFTVEDSKPLRSPLPGGIAKTFFLKGKK